MPIADVTVPGIPQGFRDFFWVLPRKGQHPGGMGLAVKAENGAVYHNKKAMSTKQGKPVIDIFIKKYDLFLTMFRIMLLVTKDSPEIAETEFCKVSCYRIVI